MKIHLPNYEILSVEEPNANDIPLAYIDSSVKEYEATFHPLKKDLGIKKVVPYMTFESYEHILFNSSYHEPTTLDQLHAIDQKDFFYRIPEGYQYIPENGLKFTPKHFSYTITGKRKGPYKKNKSYDLKISVIDVDQKMCKALIEIFADAAKKQLCPSNIKINHNDLSFHSLTNQSIADNDFIFIESTDGKKYLANDETIDYNSYLDAHTNVWVALKDLPLLGSGKAVLKESNLYNNPPSSDDYVFTNSNFPHASFPTATHEICLFKDDAVCAIIKAYENRGYIIGTSQDFVLNCKYQYEMIFEILMTLYMMSYKKSKPIEGYISNDVVDYEAYFSTLKKQEGYRSVEPFYYYLDTIYANEYTFTSTTINDEAVDYSFFNNYVYFKLFKPCNDPPKPMNALSIYLNTKEIAYYTKDIYTAQILPKVNIHFEPYYCVVTLSPFCLSNESILSDKPQKIFIPLRVISNYTEIWRKDSILYIYYEKGFFETTETLESLTATQIPLFKIYLVKQRAPIVLRDLRRRGGGLPEHCAPDYNLFDIGHINGRPLRKSGAIVIKLPTRLEPYDTIIKETISQHLVSEKMYVIIYSDEVK